MGVGSYERKEFSGGAPAAALDSGISDSDVALVIDDATNWPTASVNPFVIVIDRGLAIEEKILVGARAGTSLSSLTRGYDDTTAFGHAASAVVEHTLDASTVDQVNRLANLLEDVGDLFGFNGTNPVRIPGADMDGSADGFVLLVDSGESTGLTFARLEIITYDPSAPAVDGIARFWFDETINHIRSSDGTEWSLPASVYYAASEGARDTLLGGDPPAGTACFTVYSGAPILQVYNGTFWYDQAPRSEAIPKFANTAARDVFYPSPATGDHAYITGTHQLLEYREDEWILVNQKIVVSDTQPSSPHEGDIWLQPTS